MASSFLKATNQYGNILCWTIRKAGTGSVKPVRKHLQRRWAKVSQHSVCPLELYVLEDPQLVEIIYSEHFICAELSDPPCPFEAAHALENVCHFAQWGCPAGHRAELERTA